jgi:hypothetical protein
MPLTSLGKFKYLGLLLKAENQNDWLVSHTGATCLKALGGNKFEIIISGRDHKNRSTLGSGLLALNEDYYDLVLNADPVLSHGEIGTFDENGVSYPYLVTKENADYLFYTGWMLTVLTPFQNQLGLAVRNPGEKKFTRYSRAPIMDRNNDDYTSIGSSAIILQNGTWKMWYTAFGEWVDNSKNAQHSYCIKYAYSKDGITWKRDNQICISNTASSPNVARPTVIYDDVTNLYHMWFCYRGKEYEIGYASSEDGINWTRADELSGFSPSSSEWDKQSQCYPYVFKHQDSLYMIYCGDNYGRGGLGISRRNIS